MEKSLKDDKKGNKREQRKERYQKIQHSNRHFPVRCESGFMLKNSAIVFWLDDKSIKIGSSLSRKNLFYLYIL